ncbi:cell division protein FtsZ [Methanomassiliicoccus luminyensis]|mgnify:CR=1 FL=1|jgi:cell division protein FtsZ|uniref:cell division protein FtsZ n=1 Tax=Methanomassiliicoccus luminyensis TaxID=1080712 RepID=UPI0003778FC2|nr:cell division protein FtsZ [Methanomassiliicoccus luminyensis]
MKSLVEEALARESAAGPGFGSPVAAAGPAVAQVSSADEELLALLQKLKTNIKIIGCGGGGTNTINRIAQEGITGAELYAANTDAQHLLAIQAPHKILMGRRSTRGLGAGALPKVGEEAAMEAEDDIRKSLVESHIVFVTAGMGGGTGTGSAPYVAKIAKDMGALTIAVTTLPFKGEGKMRMENAEWGLERLRNAADTVIVIPNDKLLELVPRLSINAAFKVADEVLMRAIKGITELITKPGLVNLDFNDVKTIMKGAGVAMIGLGESNGQTDDRATEAIEDALNSPLLDVDVSSASGVLVNVVGGADMTIAEAQKVAEILQTKVSGSARIIWGAAVDPAIDHKIRVMVVITGVKSKQILGRGNDGPSRLKDTDVDFIK